MGQAQLCIRPRTWQVRGEGLGRFRAWAQVGSSPASVRSAVVVGDQHLRAFAELSMGVGREDSNKCGCKTRDTITQEGFRVSTGVTFDG